MGERGKYDSRICAQCKARFSVTENYPHVIGARRDQIRFCKTSCSREYHNDKGKIRNKKLSYSTNTKKCKECSKRLFKQSKVYEGGFCSSACQAIHSDRKAEKEKKSKTTYKCDFCGPQAKPLKKKNGLNFCSVECSEHYETRKRLEKDTRFSWLKREKI